MYEENPAIFSICRRFRDSVERRFRESCGYERRARTVCGYDHALHGRTRAERSGSASRRLETRELLKREH